MPAQTFNRRMLASLAAGALCLAGVAAPTLRARAQARNGPAARHHR